jgi:peptide deformylase
MIAYFTPMTVRKIITLPDPRLKQVSKPVEEVTDEIRTLLDDMVETVHDAPGIGLAAVQIGVLKRVVVVDISRDEEKPEPQYFVNPEITWVSEERGIYEEGCLSIPEYYEEVERPAECKVKFLDRDGNPQELHCKDMLATVIQHEVDHTNGILFIDHISRLKRDRVIRKFSKQAKQPA